MEVLVELAKISPVEYFNVEEATGELVLTSLWKTLLSAGLVDFQHESMLLKQIFDVFDIAALHGIQSLVVDVFQEVGCLVQACGLSSFSLLILMFFTQVQTDEIWRHCGVTTIECLLQWVERCIVFCENECSSISEVKFGKKEFQESLRRALALAEAADQVSTYILSWRNIEKSIHHKQSHSTGPLSQSTIKSFSEIQSVAESISFVFKCMLVATLVVKDASFECIQQGDSLLEQMQMNTETLFHEVLQKNQYGKEIRGKTIPKLLADILLQYKNNKSDKVSEHAVLALLTYCLLCTDMATIQDLVQAMHMYLTIPKEDVLIWSLAVYLDRAYSDPTYITKARLLSQEDRVCGMIPIEYLQKFMALGESPVALSLLYQKWIDPNVTSDVLGCIQILIHQGLVSECFVQLKEYLRHIPKAAYYNKARLFLREMFATGSKCGLLFQLIRFPFSVNSEEEFVIEWLIDAYEQDQDSKYVKALCLYFIIRGRIEEASSHFQKLKLDVENEWDVYLRQLMELTTRYTLIPKEGSFQFMLHADSFKVAQLLSTEMPESLAQMRTYSGLLFSKGPEDTEKCPGGVVFGSNPSRATLQNIRIRKNTGTKEPHAFDKVLGLA